MSPKKAPSIVVRFPHGGWPFPIRRHKCFVAAGTGRITAVRTSSWRLYDFFWSLDIMDWKNHEDFNTPWLLAFAIGGQFFGLAGTVLLFMGWPIRRRWTGSNARNST